METFRGHACRVRGRISGYRFPGYSLKSPVTAHDFVAVNFSYVGLSDCRIVAYRIAFNQLSDRSVIIKWATLSVTLLLENATLNIAYGTKGIRIIIIGWLYSHLHSFEVVKM